MAKITFTDKTDNSTSALADIYKVTAANVNEIKTSVNAIYDTLGGFAFYEDATTSGTPINLAADTWTDLTNDKAGSKLNLLRWTTIRTMKENFVPVTVSHIGTVKGWFKLHRSHWTVI